MNRTFIATDKTVALLLATTASLALAPSAFAQERVRDDIVVTGTLDAEQATVEIERTPGGVEVVPDTVFKSGPVQNIKDILGYVPGVITQPRMGDDARIAIRGSGLSRAYGSRGIAVLVDGVPMNTSDGLMDFFEIDPSAYRYVEVHKGGNALRFGSNALGGAVNLVTPTGRDASPLRARVDGGSFGYLKGQISTGGTAGRFDYFATVSGQRVDGFREHSDGTALRGNLNLGYRFSPSVETRFYVTAATTEQRIPGEVSKAAALGTPRAANPVWVAQDQQRNVDSVRFTNRTSFSFGDTAFEVGAFYNWRHVDHPIFQYLDYTVDDYGAFARVVDDRALGEIRNRLVIGINLHNGTLDTEQFVNAANATKGALAASMIDTSRNLSFYADNSLSVTPSLSLIVGVQYLDATRDRRDRFLSNGDQSGRRSFQLWSPKFGILWQAGPDAQLFANVSRSGEAPSYDANVIVSVTLRPQRATTYEVGTRGRSGRLGWDLSFYRSDLRDELQCLTTSPFSACSIINAPRTVHQGIEAGVDASVPLSREGVSLDLRAAYTYSDFNFVGDPVYGDNELPGVPKHYLRAEALLRHKSGVFFGPNIEWAPGLYFADNANTLTVDPYALLGLRIGFEPEQGWSFYVEGRNLTDKSYISTVAVAGTATPASQLFNPGMGRSIYAGVRFQW